MIGNLTVTISAKDPTKKCETLRAYINSPSNVRIVGVPRALGKWKITRVYFTVNYPDNTSLSKECTEGASVYVVTVSGSTLPGKSTLGYSVKADGTDETGAPIVGYVLGKGDVEIADTDGTVTPGVTTHYIHVLPSCPASPREGDAYVENGTWRFYNGTAWTVLGGVSAGNSYVMAPVANGGDGKWHRMLIVDGTLAYDQEGLDNPPLAADKPWVLTQVDSEAAARNAAISAAVSAEATARQTADATNAAAISAEATARQTADATNASAISAETTARQTADATNAAAISAETTARETADATNAAAISAEANRATAAETAEAAARAAADATKVSLSGNETINGTKTFSASPSVPTVASTSDSSPKAASTGWVTSKLAAWWSSICSSDVSFANAMTVNGQINALGGIAVRTGNTITTPTPEADAGGWVVPNVTWVNGKLQEKEPTISANWFTLNVTMDGGATTTFEQVASGVRGLIGVNTPNSNFLISSFYYSSSSGKIFIRIRNNASSSQTGNLSISYF